MNFEPTFEQKGGKLKMQAVVPPNVPEEYKQEIWERMKRDMGIKLYDAIEHTKLPVTIDIEERIIEYPFRVLGAYDAVDRLEIQITFTPVRYREVTLLKGYMEQFVAPTLLDRFYGKVRGWIYRGRP